MGAVRVYTVCDETRSKKELFILTNRFGSLIDVNQWMQKTVRSLLMSSGSSFVSSLMPGREFESLSDTKDKLETRRKDVLSRSNRRLFLKMEYQFHRRNAPITRVSSDQVCIQESGNQKRIIQPISQNLQIEPDFEENPSSR
ncbi:hypothetical protein YC2023_046614 [Brassica napus]